MMIFPFNISPTSVGLFLKECVLTHPLFIVFLHHQQQPTMSLYIHLFPLCLATMPE